MRTQLIIFLTSFITIAYGLNTPISIERNELYGVWCNEEGDVRAEFDDSLSRIFSIYDLVRFGKSEVEKGYNRDWTIRHDTLFTYWRNWKSDSGPKYCVISNSKTKIVLKKVGRNLIFKEDTIVLVRFTSKQAITPPNLTQYFNTDSLLLKVDYHIPRHSKPHEDVIYFNSDKNYWIIHPSFLSSWKLYQLNDKSYLYLSNPIKSSLNNTPELFRIDSVVENKIFLRPYLERYIDYSTDAWIGFSSELSQKPKENQLGVDDIVLNSMENWKVLNCRSFTIMGPSEFDFIPRQGIDSQVGLIRSDSISMGFDFGCYSHGPRTKQELCMRYINSQKENVRDEIFKQHPEFINYPTGAIDSILAKSKVTI